MISKDEVIKIAKLAKLSVEDEDIDDLTSEMSKIIEYAAIINECSDENLDFDNINDITNALRDDIVVKSSELEDVLKNREGGEKGYFAVKRILRG